MSAAFEPTRRVPLKPKALRRKLALKAQGGELAIRVQAGRYDTSIAAGASPSFLARRANLRSSNVATLSQDL